MMRDDYFAENISGNRPSTKKSGWWISVATLIISMIGTAILVLLIVAKWDNILSIFGTDTTEQGQESDQSFRVWDEVSLTGVISQNGDMINYTHTVKTDEYGTLWLKSTKINLNNYTDEVSFEWIIEKIYQWVPVVSVDSIYNVEFEDEVDTWDVQEEVKQTKDLPKLDMYLGEEFFEKYSLINEWDNGVLKIKELDSNQIISISYFKCNKNSINEDCDKLVSNIWSLASQSFVDRNWITYYKQPDLESWFFTNWKFGYFINDLQDSYVRNLSKVIKINKIDEETKDAVVSSWENKNDTWSIAQNNEQEQKDVAQESQVEQKKTEWNPNVAQFPINLDKALTFTSSKWHTYVFPSSNLSYMWISASENFDQAWVNCYSAMNVVKYSEKESVESYGSVVIYECNVKNGFDDSDPSLIYREVWDRDFVIKINDPAWVDFANNIVIKV